MQIAESKPIGFKNKLLLEHAVHIREQIGFSETDKNLLRNHNFTVPAWISNVCTIIFTV